MRIAYDYGLGPRIPGMHPARPGEDTEKQQVLVLRLEDGRETGGGDERSAKAGGPPAASAEGDFPKIGAASDGLVVPGTDYEVVVSAEAKLRDAEVRAHERSHLLTLGPAAESGIVLQKQTGPDGRRYAVGGSVKADLSPVPGDPKATLAKARQVIRAAYAPGSPSAADMRVAADAYRLARQAKGELDGSEWYA
jgi:hypothetical protein